MTRTTASLTLAFALVMAGLFNGGAVTAEQTNMAHAHIGHVMDKWRDTPDGQGFLPAAIAEARIAAQHAGLAVKSAGDLGGMKLHAGHVHNAVDPSEMMKGPGLGYGVKKAAMGVAQHIELAAKSEGASQNVTTHAVHVATSASNTVTRADEIVALAKQIEATGSVADASKLVNQLNTLAGQLIAGADANDDGRVGWQEGEGGLQQVEQHMGFMKKGEGLP